MIQKILHKDPRKPPSNIIFLIGLIGYFLIRKRIQKFE